MGIKWSDVSYNDCDKCNKYNKCDKYNKPNNIIV